MEAFESIDPSTLTEEAVRTGRDQLLHQMAWTRQYTQLLLDAVPENLWYVRPAGAASHVAWQVGHLAVSQYGLMLFRQRGRTPGDLELMPGWLRKQFGRGTQPSQGSDGMPTPDELRQKLAAIHVQAMREVAGLSVETLREPIDMPYAAYPIKLGALLFCPIHESIHAGQIGLLRRLHALEPLR